MAWCLIKYKDNFTFTFNLHLSKRDAAAVLKKHEIYLPSE
jgi:hypothetical protein